MSDQKKNCPKWSTKEEIRFLAKLGLGIHSESRMSRRQLLAGYLRSMDFRVWDDGMAPERIRAEVQRMIMALSPLPGAQAAAPAVSPPSAALSRREA